ncbi:unnamed protein product [Owenia fusiformis]|uniref:E3 ubiquitin-protein ligase Topors n=1 Tax=Owenia fusiformis TaxID=6347 RepID=A0A8J1U8W9_OWEFU|nr:unnamed protein product [Owenia fusiformis]
MPKRRLRINLDDTGGSVSRRTRSSRGANDTPKDQDGATDKDNDTGAEAPAHNNNSPKAVEPSTSDSPAKSPGSPENACSICLSEVTNKSFTDSCFHEFCFICLKEWSKVKAVCPLCKQQFKSIIHNVKSNNDYEQYEIKRHEQQTIRYGIGASRTESIGESMIRIREARAARERMIQARAASRLELAHTRDRLMEATNRLNNSNVGQRMENLRQRYQSVLERRHELRSRRCNTTSEFRSQVYNEGLRVDPHSILGRGSRSRTVKYRDITPEFFRQNPAQTHRLVPFLNRELNALLHNDSNNVHLVLDVIMRLITRFPIDSSEFLTRLTVYLGRRTSHFVHEFYNFARSPYDLEKYDRCAEYSSTATEPEIVDSSSPSSEDNGNTDGQSPGGVIVLGDSPEPQQAEDESQDQHTEARLSINRPSNINAPGSSLDIDLMPLLDQVRGFLDSTQRATRSGWHSPTLQGSSSPEFWSPPSPPRNSRPWSWMDDNEESDNNDSISSAGSDIEIIDCKKPIAERTPEFLRVSDSEEEQKKTKGKKRSKSKKDGDKKPRKTKKKKTTPTRKSARNNPSAALGAPSAALGVPPSTQGTNPNMSFSFSDNFGSLFTSGGQELRNWPMSVDTMPSTHTGPTTHSLNRSRSRSSSAATLEYAVESEYQIESSRTSKQKSPTRITLTLRRKSSRRERHSKESVELIGEADHAKSKHKRKKHKKHKKSKKRYNQIYTSDESENNASDDRYTRKSKSKSKEKEKDEITDKQRTKKRSKSLPDKDDPNDKKSKRRKTRDEEKKEESRYKKHHSGHKRMKSSKRSVSEASTTPNLSLKPVASSPTETQNPNPVCESPITLDLNLTDPSYHGAPQCSSISVSPTVSSNITKETNVSTASSPGADSSDTIVPFYPLASPDHTLNIMSTTSIPAQSDATDRTPMPSPSDTTPTTSLTDLTPIPSKSPDSIHERPKSFTPRGISSPHSDTTSPIQLEIPSPNPDVALTEEIVISDHDSEEDISVVETKYIELDLTQDEEVTQEEALDLSQAEKLNSTPSVEEELDLTQDSSDEHSVKSVATLNDSDSDSNNLSIITDITDHTILESRKNPRRYTPVNEFLSYTGARSPCDSTGNMSPRYTGARSHHYTPGGESPSYTGAKSPGNIAAKSPSYTGTRSPRYTLGGKSPIYAEAKSPSYTGARSLSHTVAMSPHYTPGTSSPSYTRAKSPSYTGARSLSQTVMSPHYTPGTSPPSYTGANSPRYTRAKSPRNTGARSTNSTPGERSPSCNAGERTPSFSPGERSPSSTPGGRSLNSNPGERSLSYTPEGRSPSSTPGERSLSSIPGEMSCSYTPGGSSFSSTPGGRSSSSTHKGISSSYTPEEKSLSSTPGGTYSSSTPGGTYSSSTPGGTYSSSTPGGRSSRSTTGGRFPSNTPGEKSPSNTLGERSSYCTREISPRSTSSASYTSEKDTISSSYTHNKTSSHSPRNMSSNLSTDASFNNSSGDINYEPEHSNSPVLRQGRYPDHSNNETKHRHHSDEFQLEDWNKEVPSSSSTPQTKGNRSDLDSGTTLSESNASTIQHESKHNLEYSDNSSPVNAINTSVVNENILRHMKNSENSLKESSQQENGQTSDDSDIYTEYTDDDIAMAEHNARVNQSLTASVNDSPIHNLQQENEHMSNNSESDSYSNSDSGTIEA